MTQLFRKHVPHGIRKQRRDTDIAREYNRQREYLEKSVESLQRKLTKDSEVHRQDNMRIMQENVSLIRENNDLRRRPNRQPRRRPGLKRRASRTLGTRRSGMLQRTSGSSTWP